MNIYFRKSIKNLLYFLKKKIETKNDKIKGNLGQIVTFDENGNAKADNVVNLDGAVVPASEIERLESLILSNRIKEKIYALTINITNGYNYEEILTIPQNIADGFICACPMEVWPLDTWTDAYPRLNIFDPEGTMLHIVIASPRSGNFRVRFRILYFG